MSSSRVMGLTAMLGCLTVGCGTVPAGSLPDGARPRVEALSHGTRTVHVQPGDTLFSIARRNSTSPEALMKVNPGLDPKRLEVGTPIRLPGGKPTFREVRR